MTSPHEPEKTGPGAAAPEPASPGRTGPEPTRGGTSGEVAPPWQRGAGRRASTGPAPEPAKTGPGDGRAGERVLSGSAVRPRPAQSDPTATRVEPARPDTDSYGSELPDLSGPARTTPRKTAAPAAPAKRPAPSTGSSAIQVGRRGGGPVRASMQIRRIDPWTTLKASLILSVALFFAWMIAVAFLYLILGAMGVWSKLNDTVGDLLQQTSVSTGGDMISAGSIFGTATLIGLVNIVLLTAMAALGAFVYNLAADLVGGVEVTLADRE
ncbi:DUF3566 domain-containing protein [Mycolicibacillus trivialis]